MKETKAALALDLAELRRLKGDIGDMPPMPLSRRGRIGAVLVRAVRRSLFWVWPPLHAFLDVLCRMLERLTHTVEELEARVGSFDSQQNLVESVSMELADIRAHRDHMDEAQAELWIEIARLRAQMGEVPTTGLERSAASLK